MLAVCGNHGSKSVKRVLSAWMPHIKSIGPTVRLMLGYCFTKNIPFSSTVRCIWLDSDCYGLMKQDRFYGPDSVFACLVWANFIQYPCGNADIINRFLILFLEMKMDSGLNFSTYI